MRNITYAIHEISGYVVSRIGSEVAWPILDFDAIGRGGKGFAAGNFNGPIIYKLDKFLVFGIGRVDWNALHWTKKISKKEKNKHRKFWGLKPL